ncbi:MAG: helix-turn-helix transcriptional regulator [Chloroflexales bacterium]|nr:helix-turn-helix transcriptional regulator [Chloroflexales bacterium]
MSAVDYTQPASWDRIIGLLEGAVEPRPSANCGRVQCAADWQWRPRLHDYDLWLALRGSGTMRIGPEVFPITPGTLFVLRPGDTGWATHTPDDRLSVVYLHIDFFTGEQPARIDATLLPARHVPFHDPTHLDLLLTRIVRLVAARQPLAAVEARLLLRQALIAIYQQDALNHGVASAGLDVRIEHVVAQLRSAPEQRLTLEQAAAQAQLAPGYFSRLFTREMGESFRAYALRCRLERARHLLEETTMPVGRIAASLGYESTYLFSRQFKQHFGCAPRSVR